MWEHLATPFWIGFAGVFITLGTPPLTSSKKLFQSRLIMHFPIAFAVYFLSGGDAWLTYYVNLGAHMVSCLYGFFTINTETEFWKEIMKDDIDELF
jgi:hypothetical protein